MSFSKRIEKSEIISGYAKVILSYSGMMLLSFILARGVIADVLSPFGVSFAACCTSYYLPAVCLGTVLGYLSSFGADVMTIRYASAVVIAVIASYAGKSIISRKRHGLVCAVSSFAAIFLTGIVVSITVQLSFHDIAYSVGEGLIGAASSYFNFTAAGIRREKRYASRLSGIETASVLVLFCEILISLNSIRIWYFSLSGIIGAIAVMLAATYAREKGGALTGICAGLVLGLADGMSFISGGFALGGLLAGFFCKRSRFVCVLIFTLTCGIMSLSADSWVNALNAIYDLCLAGVLFSAIPFFGSDRIAECFSVSDDGVFLSGQRQALKIRLLTAADSIKNVSVCVRSVMKILARRSEPTVRDYDRAVKQSVCTGCENYSNCWVDKRDSTKKYLHEVYSLAKNSSGLGTVTLPPDYTLYCRKPGEVYMKTVEEYGRAKGAFSARSGMNDAGNIIADQFSTVADLISGMADRMCSAECFNADQSELLRDVIENDLHTDTVSCAVFTVGEKLCTELCINTSDGFDGYEAIRKSAEQILSVRLEPPVISSLSDGNSVIRMCEKTDYCISCGGYQISSNSQSRCGDTFDWFFDGRGNVFMILSDGMGTGSKAAADSVMAQALASSLLKSGFEPSGVLNIINSSMMLRINEESTATLDIAVINLYTASGTVYKAGANFSYIGRNGRLTKIEKPSMPLGIIRGVEFEQTEIKFRDGDVFMLMSDGISDSYEDVFLKIVSDENVCDAQIMSKQTARAAAAYEDGRHRDDITVLTAIISKNI